MDAQEALAGAYAAVRDEPAPDDVELQWDGVTWCLLPVGTPAPTNVFGDPIPAKPIGAGWYIGSRSKRRLGSGDQRGGICIDLYTRPDEHTGERIDVYVCVETHLRHVYRLDITHADIRYGSPADPKTVKETIAAIHFACSPHHHNLLDCDGGWLLTSVLPVLAGLNGQKP